MHVYIPARTLLPAYMCIHEHRALEDLLLETLEECDIAAPLIAGN